MGNCLVKPNGGVSTPAKSPKGLDDDEAPKQLVVESTKKRHHEEDSVEDVKHSKDNLNKDVKRGGQRAVGKLKVNNEAPETDKLYENIKKVDRHKTNNDVMFIINALKSHFVFYNLSENELELIVEKMFFCELGPKEFVFKQGDNASSYLIVQKGSLEVIVDDKVVRTLKSGEGFGELALLYGAPRSASIKTLEPCGFWGIDRHTFRRAVEEMVVKQTEENRKFIEAVRFFQTMTNEQKDAIAGVLISQKFNKGANIVNEGDQADSFYIIKDGKVQVTKGGKEIRQMVKGDSFGEQALYYKTTRGATVKAIEPTICLALGRDTLTKILGDQVQIITFRNLQKWAFEKNPYLSQLSKLMIEKIIEAMKISNFKAGEVVAKKGTPCNSKLIVVIEGSIKKGKGSTIAKKGELWGDEYFKKESKAKSYDDDLIMESEGVLAEITNDQLTACLGGSIEEAIAKAQKGHEKKLMKGENHLKKAAADVRLEDLIFYKKLGFGQFGSVYLVKPKGSTDNQFFALKCVSKQQVVEQSLEKHLQQEKSVLEAVNFNFIMQFIRTYKDQNNIYFLVEYIKGIELWDVIRDIGLLSTYDSQFYIGSLILAIEYLHTQSIIYRDIKPENIMVEANGYLKMIDMGTAKFLKGKAPGGNRTFTIIGTPHYMAPEIITGKGYTLAVDLWSIGICLFEFMCGMVPFGEEAEDPYDIYEEIIKHPIKYPSFLKDKKAKRLMDQLINKTPEVRLGGSFAALKAHPWFDDFDWDKLLDKELKVPYTPPKDKLMSEVELKKMENLGKKVTGEIEEEQKGNHKKYKKEMAEDPNWDKNF